MGNAEKLISDLYTLRAGLSWISRKRDGADKIERQYQNGCDAAQQRAIDSVLGKFQNSSSTFEKAGFRTLLESGELECNYDEKLHAVNQQIRECNYKIENPEKMLTKSQNKMALGIFLLVLGIALLAGGIFCAINIYGNETWAENVVIQFVGPWLGILSIVAALGGVFLFGRGCRLIVQTKDAKRAVIAEARQRRQFLMTKRAALLAVPEMIQTRTLMLTALADTRANGLAPLRVMTNKMYDILVEQYGKMLDLRDWKYLDLVIYYLETHRANDVSGALQLVDRERQTQQIISSIENATESICRTIQSEMSSMRAVLQEGFSSLQKNLEIGFSSLRTNIDTNNELLKQRVSQTDLTNALLIKANVTSEKLMQDVSFLRTKMYY